MGDKALAHLMQRVVGVDKALQSFSHAQSSAMALLALTHARAGGEVRDEQGTGAPHVSERETSGLSPKEWNGLS